MSDLDASAVGEPPPPYMIFLVVFLFFVTGLLGFLVCHLLKKKGYRCRTWDTDEDEEEEEEEKKKKEDESGEDDDEDNQDTVEQILKCIIENEANMEAFKEMLGNQNVCALHDPRLLRKESLGGIPPHHHTVHSGSDRNSCHLCAQGRVKKGRRRSSRTPKPKRPREQTVFSVGRFRVIHTDKKLQGSPNPLADSGDQLNQSQDSKDQKESTEDSKEGGYNLRNMFKDVKQPTEGSNGVVPNVGKRRKSLTIFGLGRRGSDPVGMKTASLPGGRVSGGVRETALKFSQQVPAVLEEQLPIGSETGSAIDPVPYSVPLKGIAEVGSLGTSGLEPSDGLESSVCAVAQETPIPSSLAIPTSLPSQRTLKSPIPGTEWEENKMGEVYSPGPQQTSTPIAPGFGVASGLTSSAAAPQLPTSSSEGILPSGTLPSPYSVSSPDADPGIGASLASITLGSSPSSPFPVKTPSPASLRTTTSRAVLTQSLTPPPPDSRKTPTEPVKTPSSSPALKHSPQLTSVLRRSNQSSTTSLSLGRIPSPLLARTPSPALTLNAKASAMSPPRTPSATLSPGSQTSPRDASPHVGVRSSSMASLASEPDKLSHVSIGDVHSVSLASPSALLGKDGLSSQPVSPGQSLSPSLPPEDRMSSVSIVKASPDSKREFSVVTMLEEEEPSFSATIKEEEKIRETSDLKKDSAKVNVSPIVSKRGDSSVSGSVQTTMQDKELSTVHVVPSVSQGKDDIVEMKEVKQDENK